MRLKKRERAEVRGWWQWCRGHRECSLVQVVKQKRKQHPQPGHHHQNTTLAHDLFQILSPSFVLAIHASLMHVMPHTQPHACNSTPPRTMTHLITLCPLIQPVNTCAPAASGCPMLPQPPWQLVLQCWPPGHRFEALPTAGSPGCGESVRVQRCQAEFFRRVPRHRGTQLSTIIIWTNSQRRWHPSPHDSTSHHTHLFHQCDRLCKQRPSLLHRRRSRLRCCKHLVEAVCLRL
jgi:hypothetical protein